MTDELFREDGYVFEFEGEVTAVDGEYVELGGTAFYPGGGGQVCDTGAIGGRKVTEVKYAKDGNIVHRVPGHDFKVGDKLWCSVDWERRFDLMRGHTAEHLLFSSMHRQDPEIKIVKIFISPESKYVIIDRDISWDKLREAIRFANRVIHENHPVTKSVMSRDDPQMQNVRARLDRIEGDEITVVEIKDVDLSACSGVHVMETEEIGALFVDKKLAAGKGECEVHFRVGEDAMAAAMDLGNTCLQVIDELGSKPEDVVRTAANMKSELESSRIQLRASAAAALKNIVPVNINGVDVYAGTFPVSDRKALTEAAESYKSKGAVAAFVGVGETLSVLAASGDKRVDCKELISGTLSEFGGRGGGKSDFAQGGLQDPALAQKVLDSVLGRLHTMLG
jgi:alanyl-tRNA synthetase